VFAEDFSDGGTIVKLIPAIEEEEALQQRSWDAEIIPELAPQKRTLSLTRIGQMHLLTRISIISSQTRELNS